VTGVQTCALPIWFIVAALAVIAANGSDGRASALVAPVIFLPFLMDVAVTLAHRAIRKQNILSAHREHLYQLMLRLGATHVEVAVIYMGLTAISTAAAIVMLALPGAWQWLAPALLAAVFAVPAARVYRRAVRAALFSAPAPAASSDKAVEAPRQAAE